MKRKIFQNKGINLPSAIILLLVWSNSAQAQINKALPDPRTELLVKSQDSEKDVQRSTQKQKDDPEVAIAKKPQAIQFNNAVCGSYSSGKIVQSTSQLTASNGCTTIINSQTSTVYFKARDRIILSPGFVASSGTKFVAFIGSSFNAAPAIAVSHEGKTDHTISISPNPFQNHLEVLITSEKNQQAQLIIYNSLGIKMKEKQSVNLIIGYNKIAVDCSNLVKGVYLVEINIGNMKKVEKMVRE